MRRRRWGWIAASLLPLACAGSRGAASGNDLDAAASDNAPTTDAPTAAPEGGSVGPSGEAGTCAQDNDCPQPAEMICDPCFDGGAFCAAFRCVAGRCQGIAANCGGPISNPCAGKTCGAACTQCDTVDGGCYPGTCDWFNACKSSAAPVCSVVATRGCAPSDAVGIGSCRIWLGWGWDGAKCVAVVGCICRGSDCGDLLADEPACEYVFRECGAEAGGGM